MVKVGALIHVWDQVREKIKRERDPEPLWEVYTHMYIHIFMHVYVYMYIYIHTNLCVCI